MEQQLGNVNCVDIELWLLIVDYFLVKFVDVVVFGEGRVRRVG